MCLWAAVSWARSSTLYSQLVRVVLFFSLDSCADARFAVAFIVLLIVGLVLSPSIEDDLRAHDFSWIKDLFNSNSRGLHAITFCISCLGLVGLAAYVFYTVSVCFAEFCLFHGLLYPYVGCHTFCSLLHV